MNKQRSKTANKPSQKQIIEQAKNQFEIEKLYQEAEIKKMLMEQEFQYNMQLKGGESQQKSAAEKEREDRKDKRTKIQATQQSELIDQRNNNKPPKNFESSGNDIIGGVGDLSSFVSLSRTKT